MPAPHAGTAPHRIFVVDDHPYIREMVADYLTTVGGFEVCGTAGSADEALRVLPGTPCDLAVIDVSMPETSGIELVRRLRERCPDLRCLMLSGHVVEAYAAEALRAGAHGYVAKGNAEALLQAVRLVLRGEAYVSPSLVGDG